MGIGLKCTCGHYESDHADMTGDLGKCQYCACEEYEVDEDEEDEDE